MVQFLDLPRRRSTGEKLMEGLGLAAQSIPELIGTYQKSKQMGKAADYLGLKGEQRNAFLGLPPEIQAKVLPSLISEAGKRKAGGEKIPLESARYLKEFHPALADNPKAKQKISELAKKYYDEGLGPTESFQKAIEDYKGQKEAAPESEGMFGGLKEKFQEKFGQMSPEFLQEGLKAVDPLHLITRAGQKAGALPEFHLPKDLSVGQTLGSLGLGQLAPAEDIAQLADPTQLAIKLGQMTGVLPKSQTATASNIIREELEKGATPEQKSQMRTVEFLGSIIPVERLFSAISNIGKRASFMKNAEKVAAKTGTTTEEAAQSIFNQAKEEGIDLSRVAEGDKKEAAKLSNLSNRVSKEAPEGPTALRMERAAPEKRLFPTEEKMATREAQVKEFPKYQAEIEADAAERLARQEARVPKTEVGKIGLEKRKAAAEAKLPQVREAYTRSIARVRALEDEVTKLTGQAKERVQSLLDYAKKDLDNAAFELEQILSNSKTGEARVGIPEMQNAARAKMTQLAEDIASGTEIKLGKADYSPDLIKKAKEIEKRKTRLPAGKKEDFYTKVHDAYANEYRNRLAQIEREIKDLPRNLSGIEQKRLLDKEKDVLNKFLESAEAENTIHRHKMALRETAERHKAAERLKQFKETEAHPKVEKVAKEKIQEAIRNPTGKEAEEVAAKAGIKKEDLREAFQEVKKKTAEIADKAAKNTPRPKLVREINRFINEIKNKNWGTALFRTPIGQEILLTIGGVAAEEIIGKKIPYASLATAAFGTRGGTRIIRLALLYAYREGKNKYIKESYKTAVEKEDDEKVAKLRKSHPRLAREAAKELAA